MAEAEEWLRDLEDRMMEITAVEQNKVLKKKNKEDSLRDIGTNLMHQQQHYLGPKREERKKYLGKYLKR